MKKTLAVLLSVLMLVAVCIPASAVTLEAVEEVETSVEAVAGAEEAEAALAAEIDTTDVAEKYHPTHGTLIHYNDFDSLGVEPGTVIASGTNNKLALDTTKVYGRAVTISNAEIASYTVTAVTAPNGDDTTNMAVAVTTNNTGSNKWPQVEFEFDNSDLGAGTYTVVCDLLLPSGKTAGAMQIWYGDSYRSGGTNLTQGVWTSKSYSTNVTSTNGVTSVYVYTTQNTVATDCFYVDNLKVYFQETVTIGADKLNLPEGETGGYIAATAYPTGTAFTAEEGIEMYLGQTLPSLYVPGYTFLGWFDSDGNQVMGTLTTKTLDITARWQKWGPGLNMLTGTADPATFENGFKYNVGLGDMNTVAITDNISAAEGSVNTSGKVLMAKKSGYGGAYTGLNLPVVFESGRRYDLKYDVYVTAEDTSIIANMSWFYDLNGHNTTPSFTNGYASAKNKWYTLSKTEFVPGGTNETRGYVFIQNKLANKTTVGDTEVSEATNAAKVTVYYDNISFTPWYKVYYLEADGVTVSDEWYTAPTAIIHSISPNVSPVWNGEGNMKLVGWSLKGVNGELAGTTSIPLTLGEDAYLYPVYEDAGDEYLRNNVVAATNTGGQHVFVNKWVDTENTTWDVGATGATVSYNAERNSLVVKGAKVNGEISVNLAFTDGTTATETIYLVGATIWKPGLNTYTGTAKPLDFEAFTTADLIKALDDGSDDTSNFSIQTNPDKTGNNTSDKMVSVSKQFNYLFNFDFATNIEPARPVHFSYDIKSDKGQYLMINSWGGNDLYTSPSASTSWTTKQYKLCMATSTGNLKSTSATNAKTNGIKIIGVGPQTGSYAYETEGKNYQYIDNLVIIPGYKITYVTGDTSVVDYTLYSNESTREIATTYTPWGTDELVVPYTGEGLKKHIGWSTTEGATEAMTSVTLNNEDITLYPVYADTEETFTGSTLMSGKTDTVNTVCFAKALDTEATTVDTGKTDATVTYNESLNAYVITAAGYSGKVTINAVYADTTTETVEIKLLGGEKWKPGLNLITGTTELFDFENEDEVALAVIWNNTSLVADPVEGGTHGNAVIFSGAVSQWPILDTHQSQVIEAERGMLVKLDYMGSWGNFWLISKENSAYANISATSGKTNWAASSQYYCNSAKDDFVMTRLQMKGYETSNNPKTAYVDNLAFVPAYKFTYVDLDGSETVVYKITDESGNIITTHTPAFTSGATKYTVNGGTEVCTGAYTLANEDVVFTAVAPELGMEETVTSRIDVDGENVTGGIRFKASIALTDKENEAITEYGFIVAREKHLTAKSAELTHEFYNGETPLYVTGVCFDRATGKDKVFDKDATNCYFTGVCVNIPTETAATVKEKLVARPYMAVQIGENTVYVYGATNAYSLGQAMLDVKTAGGTDYTNNQTYVDGIVELYETVE